MAYFVLPPDFSVDDAHRALSRLEADYRCYQNPVYAWCALAICKRARIPQPAWIFEEYLWPKAEAILGILHEAANGKRFSREAHLVCALLFGSFGAGQGSPFKHAVQLERDREIHKAVQRQLQEGVKLDAVYSEVAKQLAVSRSTVVRAHLRMKRLRSPAIRPS